MGKTCQICGAPSGMYPLCVKHLQEKQEGKVVKCEDCGKWHLVAQNCDCKKTEKYTELPTEGFDNCVVCGEATKGYAFCRQCYKKYSTEEMLDTLNGKPIQQENKTSSSKCIICEENASHGSLCDKCWNEMIDFKDSFDKNSNSFEFRDHYWNLRSSIYRMKTFTYVQTNCAKLMALAILTKDLFGDTSLSARITNDIKEIIEKKKPKETENLNEATLKESEAKDARKEELHRTEDGHYVKSNPEAQIDDMLYSLRILHAYETQPPIPLEEQTISSDWFIPIKSDTVGIYIEYWGMTTKSYLENKERKRQAYKDHKIPLIEIEKDEINDRPGLKRRLAREINQLAAELGVKDFIKYN